MTEVRIAGRRYRIEAVEQSGAWLAHAERVDTGDAFGPEHAGATAREAVERLTGWLGWQAEHSAALEALQQAERAYHRAITGSAFVGPFKGPGAIETHKEALGQVESARTRLDQVRARRPRETT